MITRVRDFLSHLPNSPHPRKLGTSKQSKVFEVYVYCRLANAFLNNGWKLLHRSIKQNRVSPSSFIFRGSPGYIWGKTQDFSYFRVKKGNKIYELHLGVQLKGKSTIEHEIDISVISYKSGLIARQSKIPVTYSNCVVTIECKVYTKSFHKKDARGVLGGNLDMGRNASGRRWGSLATYRGISSDAERLLLYHNIRSINDMKAYSLTVSRRFEIWIHPIIHRL